MRIGIYGGTFNPVHRGHVHILEEFIGRLSLNRVLLIPTGTPPHKNAPALAPAEDRLAMCGLATAAVTSAPVEVSRLEIDRAGRSYTAETLTTLKTLYPGDDFFLLMGEDMFLTVDRWYRPETIFALAALCASPRSENGFGKLREKSAELEERGARCFVEDIPYLPVSSTEIRARAARGESLSPLVPPAVEAYIRERGLYRASCTVYS